MSIETQASKSPATVIALFSNFGVFLGNLLISSLISFLLACTKHFRCYHR